MRKSTQGETITSRPRGASRGVSAKSSSEEAVTRSVVISKPRAVSRPAVSSGPAVKSCQAEIKPRSVSRSLNSTSRISERPQVSSTATNKNRDVVHNYVMQAPLTR